MRILVIEDDVAVASFVQRGLVREGFAVDVSRDGRDAFFRALDEPYDVIILDLRLPFIDGFEVLTGIRKQGCKTPVLILSAKSDITDRVRALDSGADDYLVKPFSFAELTARLRALLRRPADFTESTLEVGDLTLDPATHTVTRGGKTIDLTPREFSLLEFLIANRGNVLTRTMISEHVWDQHFDTFSNTIDVYIRYLRAKVDDPFPTKLIRTVRGVGYVLSDKLE